MTAKLHLIEQSDTESQAKANRLADEFIDRNRTKIPRRMLQLGLRETLIALARKKVAGHVMMFAFAGESQERPRSIFDLVTTCLAECLDELPSRSSDGGDERLELHLAAEQEITSAWTGRGEKIDYATAIRLASAKSEMASHLSDVDRESQKLDLAAQAEIEAAWRSRGERITYLDAVRRAVSREGEND
jgi:hypothetical protein